MLLLIDAVAVLFVEGNAVGDEQSCGLDTTALPETWSKSGEHARESAGAVLFGVIGGAGGIELVQ